MRRMKVVAGKLMTAAAAECSQLIQHVGRKLPYNEGSG